MRWIPGSKKKKKKKERKERDQRMRVPKTKGIIRHYFQLFLYTLLYLSTLFTSLKCTWTYQYFPSLSDSINRHQYSHPQQKLILYERGSNRTSSTLLHLAHPHSHYPLSPSASSSGFDSAKPPVPQSPLQRPDLERERQGAGKAKLSLSDLPQFRSHTQTNQQMEPLPNNDTVQSYQEAK